MLNFFGGVPLRIKCDNLKTGVITHPREGEIVLNEQYINFSEHYGCAILPAGVRKPKHKPSVEGNVGKIGNLSLFFNKLDEVLAPGGQVLFDSSDICYVYEDDDGMIDLTGVEGYYGEIVYKMKYGNVEGDYFPWLYIDFPTLKDYACANGYDAELIANGEHYDYLARLIRRN